MKLKGVTPVIATILLLLITIALVGFVATFFFDETEAITDSTRQERENALKQQNTKVKIEVTEMDVDAGGPGPYTSKIYVKNTGTVTIKESGAPPNLENIILIFIDDVPIIDSTLPSTEVAVSWHKIDATDATEIIPGETVYVQIFTQTNPLNCQIIKLTTPGQSASVAC
jgi:flagellin-like protein